MSSGELGVGGKGVCSGGIGVGGIGGKVLVRDRLGVIAQAAATAAPPLVTAAAPRELRIDPCEKKKSRELRPAAPSSVGGRSRGRGCHWHTSRGSIVTFFSGKTGKKFSKKIRRAAEVRTNLLGNSSTRIFN